MLRLAFVTSIVCASVVLLGGRASAGVTLPGSISWYSMTVDEVMFKTSNVDTTFIPLGKVRMDVVGGFLYVELTNTSTGNTTLDDSGNVLTGLGFTLPTGVSLSTSMASNDVGFGGSSILTTAGSLSYDKWGLGDASSGHFNIGNTAQLFYGRVLTAFNGNDFDVDLRGNAGPANNDFDYGLVSDTAGSGPFGNEPFVKDQLLFQLALDTSLTRQQVLDGIQGSAVGLAFDSPNASDVGNGVPEPSTVIIWTLLGSVASGIGLGRRRKRTA